MRKLTDEEVKVGAERIRSRHADEWAKFIYEATRGRSIHEAAKLSGPDRRRVQLHLSRYAALYSIGGGAESPPPPLCEIGLTASQLIPHTVPYSLHDFIGLVGDSVLFF